MAGHSHSSNVKHKKDRNNDKKCRNFLKLSEKIKLIVKEGNDNDYKKAYSLARENNFPKEKVDLITKKNYSENSMNFHSLDLKIIKFDFNIFLLLYNCSEITKKIPLKSKFDGFKFIELKEEKSKEIFNFLDVLKVKSNVKFDEFLFNNLENDLLEIIYDVSESLEESFNFRVVVSQKDRIGEIVKISNSVVEEFKIEKFFVPFHPLEITEKEIFYYFERLKSISDSFIPFSSAFFNVLSKSTKDHSSVVERTPDKGEVGGSIPLGPTKIKTN